MLNPNMRFSAQTALNHSFFKDVEEEMQVRYKEKSACFYDMCNRDTITYQEENIPDCHLLYTYNKLAQNEKNEKLCKPDPNYLSKQVNIDRKMRAILVDWLQDVSVHFEVKDETLHYAIAFLNLVMSKMSIKKSNLQLVGVCCIKIAEYLF